MAEQQDGAQHNFPLRDRRAAQSFDFETWAEVAHFTYPEHAWRMLGRCESPAEAHLVRRLFESPETVDSGPDAYVRAVKISAQVPCLNYRLDLVAESEHCKLAIEVDGAHHTATRAQIAADYVRERRVIRCGYIVLRFTGAESINKPGIVWREVFATLAAWRHLARSA